jgi:hypothetical protein
MSTAVFLDNIFKIHVNLSNWKQFPKAIAMAGMKGDTAWV